MGKKKLSQAEFCERINKTHKHPYKVLEDYKTIDTPLRIQCLRCTNIFKVKPKDFIGSKNKKGTDCPKCSHPSKRKDVNDLTQILEDNGYEMLSKYENTHSKVLFKHLKCGNEFLMRPNNFFIKGNRCPKCTISKGEEIIEAWLKDNSFSYTSQYHPGKNKIGSNFLSFDFSIEIDDELILLEYDGRFHFEPKSSKADHIKKFNDQQNADYRKNEYAVNNKIPLIRIPYFDLKRIEIILDTVFNDYLHSSNTCNKCIMESTSQTIGGGNIDISKYIVNFWDKI
ncbi:g336 [Yersinia phage phiR1-37]|uniref:HNH endonuclease n=1 Tax=Yersinia phage phiR1-37 TaxID=331278 RepID=UPI00022DBDFB|nr:HNH endonuclease [Yersinia phage phiR1-37]CCE26359.1 g336 [Yersinia phage phiR1-37]